MLAMSKKSWEQAASISNLMVLLSQNATLVSAMAAAWYEAADSSYGYFRGDGEEVQEEKISEGILINIYVVVLLAGSLLAVYVFISAMKNERHSLLR